VQPVRGPGAGQRRGDRDLLLGDLRRHLPAHGEDRRQRAGPHPLYDRLTATPDADGAAGDVAWNFEKFLLAPDGAVVARFRPRTDPEADEVVTAIEKILPA
jgi:hypothetical protein